MAKRKSPELNDNVIMARRVAATPEGEELVTAAQADKHFARLAKDGQFNAVHELDEDKIAAIKDPRAQGYARTAHLVHQHKVKNGLA